MEVLNIIIIKKLEYKTNKDIETPGKTQTDFTNINILENTVMLVYKVSKKGNRKKTGQVWSDENNRIYLERIEKVSVQIYRDRDHT